MATMCKLTSLMLAEIGGIQRMTAMRVIAIPTEVAKSVRETMKAPVYGFPAHSEIAGEGAPCRHCLRVLEAGRDTAILFTYDRFAGVEEGKRAAPIRREPALAMK